MAAALPLMLEHDGTRAGWSVEQAARRFGVSVREYREIEEGERSHLAGRRGTGSASNFGWIRGSPPE